MGSGTIFSATNPKLRLARGLHRRAARAREGCLLAEGVRLVADALDAGARFRFVLIRDDPDSRTRTAALVQRLDAAGISVHAAAPPLFDAAAATESPQGVLAIVRTPQLPLPIAPTIMDADLSAPASELQRPWLLLDGVQDPGNLGSALRSAAAAGAGAVLLTPGTVDPTNPKAVRAGMGAHFRLPIRQVDWQDLAGLLAGRALWLADAHGDVIYTGADWRKPAVIVVGGEARGASTERWMALGARTLRIPMAGAVESLNAGMAAAVILFEAARGRLAAS